MTLPQLKALLKQHNMQCSYKNKDEIIALLVDKQIITAEDILIPKLLQRSRKLLNSMRTLENMRT